jgi:hypothetical protein
VSESSPLVAVWLAATVIAVGFIWLTLERIPDTITLPTEFESAVKHNSVLVGSSLSWSALPVGPAYTNTLDPTQRTVVATLDSISEAHSIQILQSAIAAGADTVLLEVNALAHEYDGMRNFPLGATLASVLAETGKRLTLIVRRDVGLPIGDYGQVRLGRIPADRQGFLLAGQASPRLFPREIWDKRALEDALATASRRHIRVLLFWPPLPEGGFGQESVRYNEIKRHIVNLAEDYGVPVWVPSAPWPDRLFMDNFGHLNAKGRRRFAAEIADWVASQ